jgi:hypothetical protein
MHSRSGTSGTIVWLLLKTQWKLTGLRMYYKSGTSGTIVLLLLQSQWKLLG